MSGNGSTTKQSISCVFEPSDGGMRAEPAQHRHMKKRTYFLIASMVIFSSVGNVLLSKGMKQIGDINDYSLPALAGIFFKAFTNSTIWLGILSLFVFFVANLLV